MPSRPLARGLRLALAAALAGPLLVAPGGAGAASAPLRCPGAVTTGRWQAVPVEAFAGTEGVQTRDVVAAYAVDARRPSRVLATNGNRVKASSSAGCGWDDVLVLAAGPSAALPFSGAASTVVATALLPGGPALAAVREGTAAASRPHVVRSASGRAGSWAVSDAGLPAQGAPRALEPAGDGRTAYLVLSPTSSGGSSGGTLPTLPGAPEPTGPAGLLYATTDGGASWELRTGAGAVAAGGIDALSVDPADPDLLYAVAGGQLLVSTDGGRSLDPAGVSGVTAVEAMEPGELVAATDQGVVHSTDAGASFRLRAPLGGVSSLAYRTGDDQVVAESQGRLFRVGARGGGRAAPVPAAEEAVAGTAVGDRGAGASFHVLAGHSLLRWVDPPPASGPPLPPPVGDVAAPPPPPGRITPPTRSVTLEVGRSEVLDFALALPPSPTPVDLVFLVDTSPDIGAERGGTSYLGQLKASFAAITRELTDAGVDVKVGLATTGAGPGTGEPPFGEVDPTPTVAEGTSYQKPVPYRLRRAVGDVDAELRQAFEDLRADNNVQTEQRPDVKEGHLIALEQLVLGDGVLEEGSTEVAPRYTVQPGQKAGFRQQEGVRKLVVMATDEAFNNPHGTMRRADGSADVEGVARLLAERGVQVIGISPQEGAGSRPDLETVARITRALAPAGGVDCGNDVRIAAGQPLVCESSAAFQGVLTGLVRSLVDEQDARLVAEDRSPVLGSIDAPLLRQLDVTVRNDRPFRVRVSCVDVAPGTYRQRLDALLRGFRVARADLTVSCRAVPPAAVPVVPPRPAAQQQAPGETAQDPPPAQPVTQVPPAPVPAPPVVQPQAQPQPQAQVQSQAQVQPLTAAALQQQEELQLALALLADERPGPGSELAMVDRRSGERARAHALLAVAMLACSAAGLARLRGAPSVRRQRG